MAKKTQEAAEKRFAKPTQKQFVSSIKIIEHFVIKNNEHFCQCLPSPRRGQKLL